jgi:hypothetical protein
MNLFYNPSLSQLSTLIAGCNDYLNYYDVLVEHDGEVLIELSSSRKSNLLPKYRFYFKDFLYGQSCLGKGASQNLQYLNQLYKNLVYCWENELAGSINFNEITEIQDHNYRIMIKDAARDFVENYAPSFFKIRARFTPQSVFFK